MRKRPNKKRGLLSSGLRTGLKVAGGLAVGRVAAQGVKAAIENRARTGGVKLKSAKQIANTAKTFKRQQFLKGNMSLQAPAGKKYNRFDRWRMNRAASAARKSYQKVRTAKDAKSRKRQSGKLKKQLSTLEQMGLYSRSVPTPVIANFRAARQTKAYKFSGIQNGRRLTRATPVFAKSATEARRKLHRPSPNKKATRLESVSPLTKRDRALSKGGRWVGQNRPTGKKRQGFGPAVQRR